MTAKPILRGDKKIYEDYWLESESEVNRKEFIHTCEFLEKNVRVLDVGCGDGAVMKKLKREFNCDVSGVEYSHEAMRRATSKGLEVIQYDLNGLGELPYAENSFDYVLCTDVLEHVFFPKRVLAELKRVSNKYIIVSTPNLAYIGNRMDLLMGREPRAVHFALKYEDSHHIKPITYKTFIKWSKELGLKYIGRKCIKRGDFNTDFLATLMPNLLANVYTVKLEKI